MPVEHTMDEYGRDRCATPTVIRTPIGAPGVARWEIDEDAVIHTSHATYRGLEDFESCAIDTASRNVGSMVSPVSYRYAQAPDHVDWDYEDDLAELALAIVAAL